MEQQATRSQNSPVKRYYYGATIHEFLTTAESHIVGELTLANQFALEDSQRTAWVQEIRILKSTLEGIDGFVMFEYSIPRMGKRVDVILLFDNSIVVLEFKVGSNSFSKASINQLMDYALDLKNFHDQSHDSVIIPILIATDASESTVDFVTNVDNLYEPLLVTQQNLLLTLQKIQLLLVEKKVDIPSWIQSGYRPTPTIIEAAQALYRGHNVSDISRSDAGAQNLSQTTAKVTEIIDDASVNHKKAICFLTGVPGAGKTLAGLNIANSWRDPKTHRHAVFLSGNGPLVEVLQEALARAEVSRLAGTTNKVTKSAAHSKIKSFIQNVHHFRDDNLANGLTPPIEKVVIFDEAQRAWNSVQTSKFMKSKKGIANFDKSEPEFLISVLDRHEDWATIICLVGEGQEIYTGEAGLQEWLQSVQRAFPHWTVYVSNQLDSNSELVEVLQSIESTGSLIRSSDLHLSTSIRSFRSDSVSTFVGALLDCKIELAQSTLHEVIKKFPIYLTRDLSKAKKWLRQKARGSERYGIVASSEALRLKPVGINVKTDVEPTNWFLQGHEDVRSSYYLEDVATEFQIQGLELDWACIAWDADFRSTQVGWKYFSFRGTKWQSINSSEKQIHVKNAYRVLLTRARQGMIIYVPEGDSQDSTRACDYYNMTYEYLRKIGIQELPE